MIKSDSRVANYQGQLDRPGALVVPCGPSAFLLASRRRAPPQQSAGRPRGFSALCWRRRGLRTDRRVRGRCADRDVPLVFLLRTAVSEAREAEPAPRFRALVARRRCPASLVARCSSRRRILPRLRASANRCSVRAEFFRLSSKNPRRARARLRVLDCWRRAILRSCSEVSQLALFRPEPPRARFCASHSRDLAAVFPSCGE